MRAPSTLGTFLRAFTFGHVRQLDAVAARFTAGLARHAPIIATGAEVPFTAFTSRGKKNQITNRLIVCVRDQNPDHVHVNAQGELFPLWRHHAVGVARSCRDGVQPDPRRRQPRLHRARQSRDRDASRTVDQRCRPSGHLCSAHHPAPTDRVAWAEHWQHLFTDTIGPPGAP